MYPRRLILEDAREHGIQILPLDVNVSEPEYVAEPIAAMARGERVGPGVDEVAGSPRGTQPSTAIRAARNEPPTSARLDEAGNRYGIRLALQDVHGISDAEIRSILEARAERPFVDVGDFLRRTTVSRPVVEALAHAGAFDAVGGGTRRDRLYEAMTTESEREGDQLTLDLGGARSGRFGLPGYSDAQKVRAELEVVGLDASRHLVSFFEPLLADLGAVRSRDLHRRRGGERVIVAGVKVASQTPAIRSGQRIIFLTLDDATGPVDVTVFESVQPKVAKTVFSGFVLAVGGTLRRTGVRGASVIAEDVWDLVALNRARREGRLHEALGGRTILTGGSAAPAEAAAPKKLWHASGGSAGW
jgi:error-prone DNA polymerase